MKHTKKYIVDEEMSITEQNDTESTGYIDDVNHVVSANNKEDLEVKLNQIYSFLQNIYTNKKLQMNGDKSAFITFKSKYDKYSQSKLKITTEKNEIIHEAEALKILGFHINRRNTMDTHLNATSSKISMILSKLKPALKYLTEKN